MPEITVGVRDLLSLSFGPRSLSRKYIHPALMHQGIKGHKDVAETRPQGYQTEVPVESAWQEGGWRLRVRGRIDGLLDCGDYLLVEEIKTTWAEEPQNLLPEHNQFYMAQLTLYAFFIAEANPDREIRARLTWWHLENLEETHIELETKQIAAGRNLFIELAREYLRREEQRCLWLRERNSSLANLEFPFPGHRPGQEELMNTVALGLDQEQDLMVEAATGIGKTVAVLLPALAWLATAPADAKVFFLTAKTSGREIVRETMERMPELNVRTVFLEAKERTCSHPEGDCDNCPLGRDFYPRTGKVLPRILEHRLLTPERILGFAEDEGLCPFELSLEIANHADLVVADYNYAFDPMVQLQRFFGRGNQIPAVLLMDEAHNLVARGREMFSADLGKKQILDLSRELKSVNAQLCAGFKELNAVFIQWNKDIKVQNGPLPLDKLPRGLPAKLSRLAESLSALDYSSELVKEFSRRLAAFNKVVQLLGDDHVVYVARQGRDTVLNLFCLNPGPLLKKQRKSCLGLYFSATLSPSSYYRELLGCREEYLDVSLPSPFPRENRLFVHIPGIKTTYAAREAYYPAVAKYIAMIIRQRRGNYIAYFPSYRYLQEVAVLLSQELPGDYLLHTQEAGMTMAERENLLQRVTGPAANIALAVMGGLLGEGVDMPGEKLVGTIIVGPGLPMVSQRQELIRDYFDLRDDSGFLYAYLIPGMLRVIQSAGRVFRTPDDRGIVVLMDDRFNQDGYRQLLPRHWLDEGLFSGNWLGRIRDFW